MSGPVIADPFALRHGERVKFSAPLADHHRWAVKLVPVDPPGPMSEKANTRLGAGLSVERSAVIGAARIGDHWAWMPFAPDTKEHIGNCVLDGDHRGEWVGIEIEQA